MIKHPSRASRKLDKKIAASKKMTARKAVGIFLNGCLIFVLFFTVDQMSPPRISFSWAEEPPSISDQYQAAIKFSREGNIKESLPLIESVYQQQPRDPTIVADYIVILTWAQQWSRATEIYEQKKELKLPDYVLPEVGRAYRELRDYAKAKDIYEKYLALHPHDETAQLGLIRTTLASGDYRKAQEHIAMLVTDHPDNVRYQLLKAEFYIEQGQLGEAQKYLLRRLSDQPDNVELQSLLAQVYLWRGWPRLALREFEKIHKQDPARALTNNGYANALNATQHKKQARDLLRSSLKTDPDMNLYLKTREEFDLENNGALRSRAYYTREFPGEDEFYLSNSLDQPIDFHHTFFAEHIRREISQDPKNTVSQKVYVGDQWVLNERWKGTAAVSFDPDTGRDLGGLGKIELTPDDHWFFQASYDPRILNVPLRSQTAGTEVAEYEFSTKYRLSDLFFTTMGTNLKDYSDGNENISYFWYTETGLQRHGRWKTNLKTELYVSTNSEQDVPYFSPKYVYSFYLVPEIEHTWFRHNDQALVDRISVGPGQLWQKGFGANNAGFVRYEQDYQLSKTTGFLVGTTYSLHNYDGADSNRWNIYSALKIRF